jgi:hypothetical protein
MSLKLFAVLLCALTSLAGCNWQNAYIEPVNTPAPPANPPVTASTPPQPANSGPAWPADVVEIALPPSGYTWAIPWCEAVCDTSRRSEVGTVSISSLKLHVIIKGEHFVAINQNFSSTMCGGLYIRSPWFGYGTPLAGTFEPIPFTLSGGYATVQPSDQQDKVYHWYSCGRSDIGNPSKVWVEARVKITGSACFQVGWDYWNADEDGDVKEGGSTRWYYDSDAPNWTVITLGY